ncbi:hypothetical protein A6E02_19545 [Aliivibrio fischeri]|nr:hypothetical protein A6E02_19545 [Aliivibrio fischeri]
MFESHVEQIFIKSTEKDPKDQPIDAFTDFRHKKTDPSEKSVSLQMLYNQIESLTHSNFEKYTT